MRAPFVSFPRWRRVAFAAAALLVLCGASPRARRPASADGRDPIPRPPVVLAWFAEPVTVTLPPLIAPACPNTPDLNLPGVLCEDFDTDRNGVAGFQWSRLPVGVDPNDPLRAVGDPDDDVLGYTQGTGPSPIGTGALTCPGDVGYPACQAPVATENDWHLHSPTEGPGDGYTPPGQPVVGAPDGGKAHGGTRSMHMGRHLWPGSTLGDTIRLRQVSAFVLDTQGDPNLPGMVLGDTSTVAFWQIIDVPDDENFGSGFLPPAGAFGGGQVQLSLLGANGRFERWRRLTPSFNGYDSFDQGTVSLCAFDPGDDTVFPNDLTMCDPAPLWADKGDPHGTDATCTVDTNGNDWWHKDCGDISCAPGPGCTENGSLGAGVWTRSAFDLSPFAGRVARLRWIGMVEGGWSFGTSRSALEPAYGGTPYYFEGDDGWWIDDIVVTDLRVAPLPCGGDADGDGFAFCVDDCDDAHASVYPGAPQICGDGLNNDCDDPAWPTAGPTEIDADSDGLAVCQGDCDDTHASVYPGAPQICDGLNNNCDEPGWPAVDPSEVDGDGDGVRLCADDCDDAAPTVYPGAPQLCDGINNDCTDPDWPDVGTSELDLDMDGVKVCQGDCDDNAPTVFPNATQLCDDGLNNNCNAPGWPSLAGTNEADDDGDTLTECAGDCDDAHASVRPGAPQICDGLNNDCNDPNWPVPSATEADADLDGFQLCAGDCDDTRSTVRPGAPQICDGLNNDCNDPLWPTVPAIEADADLDGFRICAGDCDDTRLTVRPGGPQICDGLNNNCGAPGWPALAGTNEADDDGDTLSECEGDCNDAYASVYPGAPQICDGINNDCDDPLWPAPLSSDRDADGDGHLTCVAEGPADCNDGNPAVWLTPGEVTGLSVVDILLTWQAPAAPGATSVRYDTLRSAISTNFTSAAVCVLTDQPFRLAEDPVDPAPGYAWFYVVRARNICPPPLNLGPAGLASNGTPRTARTCP